MLQHYMEKRLWNLILLGQVQGVESSRTTGYYANYNNEFVFDCKVDSNPIEFQKYVPGEWEQLLQEALVFFKAESDRLQEEKDLESYKNFMRMRLKEKNNNN